MKLSIKFLAIVALFFTINSAAIAQRGGGERGPKQTPEQVAEKQTERMAENLSLDSQQSARVQQINLTYAKKMETAREDNKENRDAMKEVRTAINKEKSGELKQVLTAEQFQTYTEMQAKRGKGRKGGKGKGQDRTRKSRK